MDQQEGQSSQLSIIVNKSLLVRRKYLVNGTSELGQPFRFVILNMPQTERKTKGVPFHLTLIWNTSMLRDS